MVRIWRGDDVLLETPINVGSKAKRELMSEDSITLKFTLRNALILKVGDYINDSRLGWFILVDDYYPVYNSSNGGYDYNVRFDAYYYVWRNRFLKYHNELSFKLTADIDTHVTLLLDFIKSCNFLYNNEEYVFNIDETVTDEHRFISYENIHVIDALSLIAETFECEWWIEDNVIHLGKCVYDRGVRFDSHNVSVMTPNDSSEETGTRLYVFGSDKNIPANYREVEASDTVNAVVQRRLMLPVGIPYLGTTDDASAKEFVKTFDVFPKLDCRVSDVSSYKKSVENSDGTTNEETFYQIKTSDIKFSNDYLTENDLTIVFESGSLGGMEFTCVWKESDELFELIANESYGRKLPDTSLFPKKGDKFVLLNWDTTKTDLGLIEKAEQELLKQGIEYFDSLDTSSKTFTCTLFSNSAKEVYQGHLKSLYNIGDTVTLYHDVYFPNGRESRIIGYEYNLDVPYDKPVYTVGQSPKYSRLNSIENNIEGLTYNVTVNSQSVNPVYVIGRNDSTLPTDRNVLSSLRSMLDFLRRNQDDTAEGIITFEKGLVSKMTAFFTELSSPEFANGFAGNGFRLAHKDGVSSLELDEITVRKSMNVFELLIQRIKATGGQIVVSASDGRIKEIEDRGDSYYISFEQQNTFCKGDLIRCQVFSGGIRGYWVEALDVDNDGIIVLKTEFADVPAIGDECVLMGNTENKNRQSLITISATGDGQPRIDILDGVKNKSLDGCLRARFGNLEGIRDAVFGENQPKGHGLYSDNAYLKGEFVLKNSGKSIDTMFSVTEGKIQASVEQTQSEAIKGKTLLYNASFTKGLEGWLTSNTDSTYFSGTSLLFASGSMLAQSVTVSNEPVYDNVFFVNIKNGWIKQSNMYFVNKPDFDAEKQYPLFFSTNIRCNKSGVLNVYLTNIEASNANTFIGYSDAKYVEGDYIYVNLANNTSLALQLSELGSIAQGDNIAVKVGEEPQLFNLTNGYEIPITDWREEQFGEGYVELAEPCNLIYTGVVGKNTTFTFLDTENLYWNGQGDFYLSFSGEADFYGLTIYTEKTEVRNRTFFDMSDRLISFGAQQLNADGTISKESGIVVQPEGAGLYSKGKDGKQSRIATYEGEKVVLEGESIQLKGNLTADGNFKVREDGSIEATNGSFNGYLINKPLKVTEANYRDFFTAGNEDYASSWSWRGWVLCSCVMLKYTSAMHNDVAFGTSLTLPSIDARTVNVTEEELDTIRSFIGQSITIYNDNNTNQTYISYYTRLGNVTDSASQMLEAYTFATFNCKVAIDADGQEMIYWDMQTTGKIKQIDNDINV